MGKNDNSEPRLRGGRFFEKTIRYEVEPMGEYKTGKYKYGF